MGKKKSTFFLYYVEAKLQTGSEANFFFFYLVLFIYLFNRGWSRAGNIILFRHCSALHDLA